jgi:hypothetical protein
VHRNLFFYRDDGSKRLGDLPLIKKKLKLAARATYISLDDFDFMHLHLGKF